MDYDQNYKYELTCLGCGVVVNDTELHDKFHEDLARAASEAQRANAWTTPIGGGKFENLYEPNHLTAQEQLDGLDGK